jgi:YD repeat-containing protein
VTARLGAVTVKGRLCRSYVVAVTPLKGSVTVTRRTAPKYAYDANGNLTAMTDPLNRVTTQSFDALNGRVTVAEFWADLFL